MPNKPLTEEEQIELMRLEIMAYLDLKASQEVDIEDVAKYLYLLGYRKEELK